MDYRQINDTVTIKCVPFDQLDIHTLYDVLALRASVFCVEQDCAYLDLDGRDQAAWHVLAYKQGVLVGTARILTPGASYQDACSIGRVASQVEVRRQRIGLDIMRFAVDRCIEMFPEFPIHISAQKYLIDFYRKFGFVEKGASYLEDGLPHILMIKSISTG